MLRKPTNNPGLEDFKAKGEDFKAKIWVIPDLLLLNF